MKRIGLVALLALTLAVPASASSGGAHVSAGGAHKITVIGGDNKVIANFHTAKCKKKNYPSRSIFSAVSFDSGYKLEVYVEDFSGFHDYNVTQGPHADPEILLEPTNDNSGDGDYSNRFQPPYPVPGAGDVHFAQGGKLIGAGFGPAMWRRDGGDAVVVAGVMTCKYGKKKGKS